MFDCCMAEFETKNTPSHKPVCVHDFVQDEGMLVCRTCSVIERGIFVSSQEYHEVSYTAYKRITHIKSNLTRFIGREDFILPQSVISIIKKFNPITVKQVRQILKSQGLTKYYIHTYAIASRVGLTIPSLSQAEYDKVVYHFNVFNSVYSKQYYSRNMISYHFILYKLFNFIGRSDLLHFLSFGTNKTKINNYELIWNKCFTCCK